MLRSSLIALTLAAGILTAAVAQDGLVAEVTTAKRTEEKSVSKKIQPKVPRIQMAILLDTSGSMSGLIDQARTQVWNIVNEFATTKQNGRRPKFELALFEYGKSSLPSSHGYIRRILPFTDNLDLVSEELFKLKTKGGSEHCGQVIAKATAELQWSDSSEDLKCIFIAGNERFTQGPVDYRKACADAIAKGVVVNTIHCGKRSKGIAGDWGNGALLADGNFTNINHNAKINIAAPQDKELVELSAEVNKTYIPYGTANWRATNSARQVAEDGNASKSGSGVAASRGLSKLSAHYCNPSWDLVDALKDGAVKLADVKEDQLPENMRKMTLEQRGAYVKEMAKKRIDLKARAKALGKARETYVATERKKIAEKTGQKVLGGVIIETARQQAAKKGFVKPSAPKKPAPKKEPVPKKEAKAESKRPW